MKFSLAVACLIGTISAKDDVWALISVTENADDAKNLSNYVNYATAQSNKEIKDSTHLQVDDNLSSDDE